MKNAVVLQNKKEIITLFEVLCGISLEILSRRKGKAFDRNLFVMRIAMRAVECTGRT